MKMDYVQFRILGLVSRKI